MHLSFTHYGRLKLFVITVYIHIMFLLSTNRLTIVIEFLIMQSIVRYINYMVCESFTVINYLMRTAVTENFLKIRDQKNLISKE